MMLIIIVYKAFGTLDTKAIAQASNIIKMIDEGKSKTIDYQLGECYYIRGMMYFYLGRAFRTSLLGTSRKDIWESLL
ncbi:hypothetical protein NXW91_23770 [Bacteroides fragilis]|nr:hypothetical protein [Bacteroides fragilis]